ncbi:MAG: membrane protein insertion efficiency factor YidD [Alphaproteobacteria bacterium]|nr:membrane protein insertion efficiency factor YidD [Alphaproteobacteria bacterium]
MNAIETLFRDVVRVASTLGAMAGIALVWGYRLLLAPLFPATCRYNPSCSAYAIEALKRFGPVKGSLLATRRLLRCHPWGDCGDDPVPSAFSYRDFLVLRRERS